MGSPVLLALLLAVVPAQAGSGANVAPVDAGRAAAGEAGVSRAERLERWRALDPKVRAALVERYRALQALPEEDRQRLLQRAERVEREIERTLESLGPEERSAIAALEPRERRRVVRGLLADRARMTATSLRRQLSEEQRAALEIADRAEREALVRSVRESQRERMRDRLGRLGGQFGLTQSDLGRLERGGPEERGRVMIEFARRRSMRYVAEYGLPSGVSSEEWRALVESADEDFARGYLRIRSRHPEFGVPPARWEQRLRRQDAASSRLEAFARPSMQSRARWAGASDREVRKRTVLERRAEIQQFVVSRGRLDASDAERLRSLEDEAFLATYFQLVLSLRRGADLGAAARRALAVRERGERSRGPSPGRRRPPR